MSPPAQTAFTELLQGKICIPDRAVADELGRLGLACKRLANSRSNRIMLTSEGAKYIRQPIGKP